LRSATLSEILDFSSSDSIFPPAEAIFG
jgi:hypothetical protein